MAAGRDLRSLTSEDRWRLIRSEDWLDVVESMASHALVETQCLEGRDHWTPEYIVEHELPRLIEEIRSLRVREAVAR